MAKKLPKHVYTVTQQAIRDGKLIPEPCEVCGNTKVEAHHDDYSKPLQIRWLCHKHHRQLHSNQPKKKTGSHVWQHGEKTELARLVGVSPNYLGQILIGPKSPTPELAVKIRDCAAKMGIELSLYDLLFRAISEQKSKGRPLSAHNWQHGQKAELARRVGISIQYLSNILNGYKRATPDRAKAIVAAAMDMGISLSLYDLIYPEDAEDPDDAGSTPQN